MRKHNRWILAAAAAILATLIAGGAAGCASRPSASELAAQLRAANAEKQLAQEQAAQAQADALKASQAASASAETTTSSTTTTTTKPAKKKTVTVKQFSFVKKVTEGSTNSITADYALMLSGKAAAKAATAHGDESPPPNDYYIVNDNKMLRKLPVKSVVHVTITSNADGTSDPTGHVITFAKWASYYSAPDDGNQGIRTGPYWLTITNGVVTAISQQYLP